MPAKSKVLRPARKQLMLSGNVPVEDSEEIVKRVALLLWGAAGCGKTTWAATSPGKKLWLSLGDQEHASVSHRKDVVVADYSKMTYEELFKHCQNDNPFGLDQYLAEDTETATIVLDSVTALAFRALQKSVSKGYGKGSTFTPTMEMPGLSAYGGRNAIVLEVLTGILRVAAKHGAHCIITAHEADPHLDQKTSTVKFVSMQLGGQLVNGTTRHLSEIWYMSQESGKDRRRIAVRPTRLRKPMKTRMFSGKGPPEFYLEYDPDKPDTAKGQMTIMGFLEDWEKANHKIDVPSKVKVTADE